jgi:hypothetical protein
MMEINVSAKQVKREGVTVITEKFQWVNAKKRNRKYYINSTVIIITESFLLEVKIRIWKFKENYFHDIKVCLYIHLLTTKGNTVTLQWRNPIDITLIKLWRST